MPTTPIPDDLAQLLGRPNPCIIATLRPDGQPVTVATWYLWQDGAVLVNMDAERRRLSYLRNDPRVSLTILAGDDWYSHLSIQGRVTELRDDPELTDIDTLSRHYTGQPYPTRDRRRVSATIAVDRWHAWGELAHQA